MESIYLLLLSITLRNQCHTFNVSWEKVWENHKLCGKIIRKEKGGLLCSFSLVSKGCWSVLALWKPQVTLSTLFGELEIHFWVFLPSWWWMKERAARQFCAENILLVDNSPRLWEPITRLQRISPHHWTDNLLKWIFYVQASQLRKRINIDNLRLFWTQLDHFRRGSMAKKHFVFGGL